MVRQPYAGLVSLAQLDYSMMFCASVIDGVTVLHSGIASDLLTAKSTA